MREIVLYIGTYTRPLPHVNGHGEGIYRCRLDVATGALACDGVVARLDNPTFLACDATGQRLYTISEADETASRPGGALHGFAIAGAGLIPLNWRPTGGAAPCHLALDPAGRCVLTANYNGGSVSVLPVEQDGRVGPLTQLVQHTGAGPHPIRQRSPHPHGVYFDRTGRALLVPDLGTDRVHVYRFSAEQGTLMSYDTPESHPERSAAETSASSAEPSKDWAALHPGAGPRRLALHPNGRWVYCINELDITVSLLTFDPDTGRLAERGWVSLLPNGHPGGRSPKEAGHSEGRSPKNLASAAEIALDPAGRFAYASLRGHDCIAVLAVTADGGLTPVGHEPTQGCTPRHFALSPDGRLLVAANQDSDSLVTFRVNPKTGGLTPTGHAVHVPSPACVMMEMP